MRPNDAEQRAGLAATPGYRYADRVGDQLVVAGQVPLDGDGQLVGPGDPATQATRCLDNLRTLITVHGFAVDDVRHLTIHVVGERPALVEAWSAVTRWFGDDLVPPATLLGAAALGHADQLVEVDATVLRPPTDSPS